MRRREFIGLVGQQKTFAVQVATLGSHEPPTPKYRAIPLGT
jgi:hypothetical protein